MSVKKFPSKQSHIQDDLILKLLAHYDLNKDYVDIAEKFLLESRQSKPLQPRQDNVTKEDIERMYAHAAFLEDLAKLLHEAFLKHKNAGE